MTVTKKSFLDLTKHLSFSIVKFVFCFGLTDVEIYIRFRTIYEVFSFLIQN